jgi:hypothetical protein
MTLTDTHLSDPTAKVVHATILDAFRVVSKQGSAARISHTQVSVKRAAARATTEREGTESWASRGHIVSGSAGQVLVAWWTALTGRRHVRVIGRTLTTETAHLLNTTKLSTRPAVWHVFPDRVYRRRTGQANDLIAVCGCGAVGTEQALGWAGPCCGPCDDFRAEHGTLPWKRPALLLTPEPCTAVAGSADGRWVAAAFGGGARVHLWDTEAAGEPSYTWSAPSRDAAVTHLALAPDGRYLVPAGRAHDRFYVLDLHERPPRVAVQMARADAVAFHPGGALYFVTGGSVLVSAPPVTRPTGSGAPVAGATGPLAFGGDSRLAVVCGQSVRICASNGGAPVVLPLPLSSGVGSPRNPLAVPHTAFSPDGGQVAIGYNRGLVVHHAATGEQRFLTGTLEAEVSGVAFGSGGKWLFVGRRDGTLVALHTDTFATERSVVFRWSLGPIRALAMCGQALLTACDEGVQLWPMPKLLEGL